MNIEILFWTVVALWMITMARMTSLQSAIKKLQGDAEAWSKNVDKNIDHITEAVTHNASALVGLLQIKAAEEEAAIVASTDTLPPPRRGKT